MARLFGSTDNMLLQVFLSFKGTVSLDNQPRVLRITIGSHVEVVVHYLIFAGILYSKQIKLPTILTIETES